jgi:hypothetical protein
MVKKSEVPEGERGRRKLSESLPTSAIRSSMIAMEKFSSQKFKKAEARRNLLYVWTMALLHFVKNPRILNPFLFLTEQF